MHNNVVESKTLFVCDAITYVFRSSLATTICIPGSVREDGGDGLSIPHWVFSRFYEFPRILQAEVPAVSYRVRLPPSFSVKCQG